jgi:anti-sigma-K factor RskA
VSGMERISETRDCGGDAAAYVLGALNPAEVEPFEQHLADCAICRDEVSALRGVIDALPMAAPQYSTPEGLCRRTLQAVRLDARRTGARPRHLMGLRRLMGLAAPAWALRGVALAGGCAAVALAVFAGFELSTGSHVRVIQARVVGISGRASVRLSDGHSELIVRHLSAPPPGDIYELWLKRPHRAPAPTSALFSVTAAGAGEVDLPPRLHGVSEVMVTPEPAGGSPFPTHSPVIVARLT